MPYYDPNLAIKSKQKRELAKQFLLAGQQPQQTEMVGGIAVAQSPLAGLARALSTGLGGYEAGQANQADQQAAINRQMLVQAAMQNKDPQAIAGVLSQDPELLTPALQYSQQGFQNERQDKMLEAQDKRLLEQQNHQDRRDERNAALQRELLGTKMDVQGNKLSPTSQKELYDTIDTVNLTQGAVRDMHRASQLLSGKDDQGNPVAKPYSGYGSELRTDAARLPLIGGLLADKDRAAATTEYSNLVSQQALQTLKSTFGGNPTEGERAILLQMQALPKYTEAEQGKILANAERALEARLKFNQSKAQNIQTGNNAGLVDFKTPPAGASGGWSIEPVD